MGPGDTKRVRQQLGLTLDEMAAMLGYEGEHAKSQMQDLENGRRPLRPAQRLLLEAYLNGYRPQAWPQACIKEIGAVQLGGGRWEARWRGMRVLFPDEAAASAWVEAKERQLLESYGLLIKTGQGVVPRSGVLAQLRDSTEESR